MPDPVAPTLEQIIGRPREGPKSIVDLARGVDREQPPAVESSPGLRTRAQLTYRANSLPVVVPRRYWPEVLCGTRRMYRTYSGLANRQARLIPAGEQFPRPAVIYSWVGRRRRFDTALAVILDHRHEPAGAITPADLELEGFPLGLNQFIRHWRRRYPQIGWRPLEMVNVIELRPWREGDDEEQGAWLLRQVYGEWL